MASIFKTLELAKNYHAVGALLESRELFIEVLKVDDKNFEALHHLGVLAGELGDHNQALELLSAANLINGTSAELHCNLGHILINMKEFDDAKIALQKAISFDNKFFEAFFFLGCVESSCGNSANGIACFQKALSLSPEDPETLFNLANETTKKGMFEQSVIWYLKAFKLNPDYQNEQVFLHLDLQAYERKINLILAYFELSLTYHVQGDYEAHHIFVREAADLVRQNINLFNDKKKDINKLLDINLMKNGSLKLAHFCIDFLAIEGRDEYNGIVDEATALAISAYKVGNALKALGENSVAQKFYKKSLCLRPDYAAANNEYGEVLLKLGKLKEAQRFFRNALQLDYSLASAYFNLFSLHDSIDFYDFKFMLDMLENFNGDQEEIKNLPLLSRLNSFNLN